MVRAGQMRHRCLFERRDTTPDDYGNVTAGGWVAIDAVWGQLIEAKGRESIEAGRMESAVGAVLRVRSSATMRTITAADRVTIRGEVYAIRAIGNPDQRNEVIEMVVERGVGV